MKQIKRAKLGYIGISAAMIVLGIIIMFFPQISSLTVCCIIGAVVTLFGVVKLIGYFSNDLFRLAFQFDFALGIFAMVAGILFLIHPTNIVKAVPVIIGVFVLMDGAFKLQTSYDARKFGMNGWWSILILALVSCLGGLFLIINPFASAMALMILLGAILVIDGIQNLVITAYTVKATRPKNKESDAD